MSSIERVVMSKLIRTMEIFSFIFEAKEKRYNSINEEIEDLLKLEFKDIKRRYLYNHINKGENKDIYMTFTPGKYLLKLSRNSDEIKREIEIYNCYPSLLLTKIYGYDNRDYNWVIVEEVQTIQSGKQFEEILLNTLARTPLLYDLKEKIEEENSSLEREFVRWLRNPNKEDVVGNAWMNELLELISRCGLDPNDLYQQNWGIRNNSELVIIDYGFEGFDQ